MLTSYEMLRYVEVSDERGAYICRDKHSVELLDPEEEGSYSFCRNIYPASQKTRMFVIAVVMNSSRVYLCCQLLNSCTLSKKKPFPIRFKAVYTNDKDFDHT